MKTDQSQECLLSFIKYIVDNHQQLLILTSGGVLGKLCENLGFEKNHGGKIELFKYLTLHKSTLELFGIRHDSVFIYYLDFKLCNMGASVNLYEN